MSKDAKAAKPTIYTIAERLGLSASAVSRALNHPGRMNQQTEELIRRTAEEMGYARLQQPRRATTSLVAVVVPDLSDRTSAELLRAIKQRLDARGRRIMVFEEADVSTVDGMSSRLVDSGVGGVILHRCASLPDRDIQQLALKVPTIVVDRDVPRVVGARIDPDRAVEQALDRLRELGHTGVVYLQRETPTWLSEHVAQLIARGCATRGLQFRVLHNCLSVMQAGPGTLERLLGVPATATFASTGTIAAGLVLAAERRGIRVPQDLTVVMLGGNPYAPAVTPAIASVTEPMDALGRTVAETLVTMIEDPKGQRTTALRQPSAFEPHASLGTANGPSGPARRTATTGHEDPMRMQTGERITLTLLSPTLKGYAPILERYHREHPNVEIRAQLGGRAGEHPETQQPGTLGQEGTLAEYRRRFRHGDDVPDLLVTEYRNVPQLAGEGLLLNFASPLIESTYGPRFRDDCWRAVHCKNGLYGIPYEYGPLTMFYREDVLDRFDAVPPRTWDELIELGARIHAQDPSVTLTWLNTLYATHYVALLQSGGADPWTVDDEHDRIDFRLGTARAREVASTIQRGIDCGAVLAEPFTGRRRDDMFADGSVPLTIHGGWQAANITRACPGQEGLWKVAMPPAFGDPSGLRTAIVGDNAITVSAAVPAGKRAAALHLAFWMASNPAAVDMMPPRTLSATQYFHRRMRTEQRDDPFFEQPLFPVFLESADLAAPACHLPFSTQVEVAFQQTMAPFLSPGGASQDHLADWQEQLVAHAVSRGYEVVTHDGE